MEGCSELQSLRDVLGVPHECRDCGNTAEDEGFKMVPARLEAADAYGHGTEDYGRFEAIICRRCGTVTLVDETVFAARSARVPALAS